MSKSTLIKLFLFSVVLLSLASCDSGLSQEEKQNIYYNFDYKSIKKNTEIIEIKQIGKKQVGEYFCYKKFEIKVKFVRPCVANLFNGIAMNEFLTAATDASAFDTLQNRNRLIVEKFDAQQIVTIRGVLFSVTKKDVDLLDGMHNCLFYIPKSGSSLKENEKTGCIDGQKYYKKGLTYTKFAFPDAYQKIAGKGLKLKEVDKCGMFFIGADLIKEYAWDDYIAGKLNPPQYLNNILDLSVELYINVEEPTLICKD